MMETKHQEPRSSGDILRNLQPKKSGKAYQKDWNDFMQFAGTSTPGEDHLIRFFDMLRNHKKLESSTIWVVYSHINFAWQMNYGAKLQDFPRVTALCKSYNAGYRRKVSKTMTIMDVCCFLRKPLETSFWIVRKAMVSLAWCGGLRCDEIWRMKLKNLERKNNGYLVTLERSKQTGEVSTSIFMVPSQLNDLGIQFSSYIDHYLDVVQKKIGILGKEDSLFVGTHGGRGFVRQPMGIGMIRELGKVVANEISLEEPQLYTGHCWRRSSATQAAGQGATSSDLKRTYGWKQEQTAMKYLDNNANQAAKMAELITQNTSTSSNVRNSNGATVIKPGVKSGVSINITVQAGATININN